MAFRQLYSAESTCSLVSLSTWSWNTLTWSMKDTTRSADMGEEWKPAAASRGAMWSGRADWAAFRMNSSLQLSLSRATCECFCVLIRFAYAVIIHFLMFTAFIEYYCLDQDTFFNLSPILLSQTHQTLFLNVI